MRDIVTASYNHTPKAGSNKTEYKSYRDFLENYGDKNSKDDAESVSSNDSGVSSYKLLESKSNNTSTSSLNSDVVVNGGTTVFSKGESTPTGIMGGTRTGSFRKYLDNYNNKKFSSVKPAVLSKPNVKTTVKSEIVIQVSDPLDLNIAPTSPKHVIQRPPPSPLVQRASSASPPKVPLSTSRQCSMAIPPPPPPIVFKLPQHPKNTNTPPSTDHFPSPPPNNIQFSLPPHDIPPPPPLHNIPSSATPVHSIPPPPPVDNISPHPHNIPPPPPVDNIPPPPPMMELLDCKPKKWATVETENSNTTNNEQPKIQKNNVAAANLAKILNEHVLARRKKSDAESPSAVINSEACSKQNVALKASTLPRQLEKSFSSPGSFQKASVSPPRLPASPVKLLNASPKLQEKSQVLHKLPPSLPRVQRSLSPKSVTNVVDSVDFCTTTVVPVADGSTNVSKGDPNVKKLVYNTYRGLLGAYNNKANDMISTLPRNMVREDKGVAKQVESISLQCRLDKLNGRINPKLEQD